MNKRNMNQQELVGFLNDVPDMVYRIVDNYMGTHNNHRPRFDSVFKVVKEELKYNGFDYKSLSEVQQNDIKDMALDAFEGMREAGF